MTTKKEFLALLDELMEEEPGTLTGSESLKDIERWDSLAVMGFIALVDERFGLSMSPKRIAECKTINDLINLLDGQVLPDQF